MQLERFRPQRHETWDRISSAMAQPPSGPFEELNTEPGQGFRVVELQGPQQPPLRPQVSIGDQRHVFPLGGEVHGGVCRQNLGSGGTGDWFRGNGSGVGAVAEIGIGYQCVSCECRNSRTFMTFTLHWSLTNRGGGHAGCRITKLQF